MTKTMWWAVAAVLSVTGLAAWFGVAVAVWSYPVVRDAITPWFPLAGPSLGVFFVWLGWRKTHTDATSRDFENWRRSEITRIAQTFNTHAFLLLHKFISFNSTSDTAKQKQILEDADEIIDQMSALARNSKVLCSGEYLNFLIDTTTSSMRLRVACLELMTPEASDLPAEHVAKQQANADKIFTLAARLLPVCTRLELMPTADSGSIKAESKYFRHLMKAYKHDSVNVEFAK